MRRVASLALLVGAPLLAGRAARAAQYEVFVEVETEQALYDLRNDGQISEHSFETLKTLMDQPVNLNAARRARVLSLPNIDAPTVDRILAHRAATGTFSNLQDLVDASILSPEVARTLRPFVQFEPANDGKRRPARGSLRLQTRFTGRYDLYPPAMALQARLSTARGVQLGLAASLRRQHPGPARFDPRWNALSAAPPRVRPLVPKLFLLWRDERWSLVAGTYQIGFAQSLVFDTTAEESPHGLLGDDALSRPSTLTRRCRERAAEQAVLLPCGEGPAIRVTPDYSWTNGLTGVALGWRSGRRPRGWREAHAWASYQVHRASQYELRLSAHCPDPQRDDDACAPPAVLVRRGDVPGPKTQWTSTSFARMYAEALGGAKLSHFWSARRHVGITGYGAKLHWMSRGAELGLQESARLPYAGPFGAVGLDLAYGRRRQDFQVELARSFDRQSRAQGGWAAIARSSSSVGIAQIDVSARYYASRYANPHARPTAAADELDGLRARDETGLRVRTWLELGDRWNLRSAADFWTELSTAALKSELRLRADFEPGTPCSVSMWAAQRSNGRGRSITAALRLLARPSERLRASVQLQHDASRGGPRDRRFAKTFRAIATFTSVPSRLARLTLRLRYDGELGADASGLSAQVWWAYLSTDFNLPGGNHLQLRYDFRFTADRASSRAEPRPNPENWFALEYLWRFP